MISQPQKKDLFKNLKAILIVGNVPAIPVQQKFLKNTVNQKAEMSNKNFYFYLRKNTVFLIFALK